MKTDHLISLICDIRDGAHRLIEQELAVREIRTLAPSHGAILDVLYEHDPLPMNELARRIKRDKSTVTTLVKKLEKLGYVRRLEDSADGRVSLIGLTEKSRMMRTDFGKVSEKLIQQAYEGFSMEEKYDLITYLERIYKNL